MSDSYVRLQPFAVRPSWVSPKNDLFRGVRQDFGLGVLKWEQAAGFLGRLFSTNWQPDFTQPAAITEVPSEAWSSAPVALQNVEIDADGYCKALGLRFGPLTLNSSYPLHGCCIYEPYGRIVWAATDHIGTWPLVSQDVYVVWDADRGVFRL